MNEGSEVADIYNRSVLVSFRDPAHLIYTYSVFFILAHRNFSPAHATWNLRKSSNNEILSLFGKAGSGNETRSLDPALSQKNSSGLTDTQGFITHTLQIVYTRIITHVHYIASYGYTIKNERIFNVAESPRFPGVVVHG